MDIEEIQYSVSCKKISFQLKWKPISIELNYKLEFCQNWLYQAYNKLEKSLLQAFQEWKQSHQIPSAKQTSDISQNTSKSPPQETKSSSIIHKLEYNFQQTQLAFTLHVFCYMHMSLEEVKAFIKKKQYLGSINSLKRKHLLWCKLIAQIKILDKPLRDTSKNKKTHVTTCVICQESIPECYNYKSSCQHNFHRMCIRNWMVSSISKGRCPICRSQEKFTLKSKQALE